MFWQLKITGRHLLANLSTELYKSADDCLWELVRNGLCACMPEDQWVPQPACVELWLVKNHPLSPRGMCLVILDRGRGFTDASIKLFCAIGPSMDDHRRLERRDSHHGAAQKRIGRFAAFALNQLCLDGQDDGQDITSGFYILTRTTKSGPVNFVPMIPAEIEQRQGFDVKEIDVTSAEMGPLRNINGSFTAIVIPNPVLDTYEQIREGLKWRIPRKEELMFTLKVDNRQLMPPRLVSRVTQTQEKNPQHEVYLDRHTNAPDQLEGIWLTDAHTGLRVASAARLGPGNLPSPFWRQELTGDMFAPGLLKHQDTSRSGLNAKFLKSQAWRNFTSWLALQVQPQAESLLTSQDTFGRDSASQTLFDVVKQCNAIFGTPEDAGGGVWEEDVVFPPGDRKREGSQRGPGGGKEDSKPAPNGRQFPPSGGERRRIRLRSLPLRIRDKTFFVAKRSLDPFVLASVDTNNGQVIYFNDQQYDALPRNRDARAEHVLLKILEAAGQYEYPDDPYEVTKFVAECRKELLNRKKR